MVDEEDLPSPAQIEAEILKFPDREPYPGFFEDFRRVKAMMAEQRAMGLGPKAKPGPYDAEALDALRERVADTTLKVVLVLEYFRQKLLAKQANDNKPETPSR